MDLMIRKLSRYPCSPFLCIGRIQERTGTVDCKFFLLILCKISLDLFFRSINDALSGLLNTAYFLIGIKLFAAGYQYRLDPKQIPQGRCSGCHTPGASEIFQRFYRQKYTRLIRISFQPGLDLLGTFAFLRQTAGQQYGLPQCHRDPVIVGNRYTSVKILRQHCRGLIRA